MACGPQEETSEQAVNPTAILRAMRTAIAQEVRARFEAGVAREAGLVSLMRPGACGVRVVEEPGAAAAASCSVTIEPPLLLLARVPTNT
jgi:hypothetical protein